MALTATLSLDIRNFEAAIDTAEVSLQTFAKASKTVDRDLARMGESFSGDKVKIQAELMAKAVNDLGGASMLTEKEQAKVNATVTEAIAKYRALGQDAPNALVKLQKETAGAVEKTSLLSSGVKVLIGLFSARAILNAAGQVLEFTGNLQDMSDKTGIAAEGLQRLGYVTGQSGVTLDQVSAGAVKMGKALVGGDKSAVEAVNALGFSVTELIAQGPEEAFLSIGEAIAKVPNPMEQAALATAIFGKAGADYLPAFTTDMKALADQAQASGAILSNDMVQAGDNAGDALTRLKSAGLAVLAQFLIPLLPAVEAAANWLGNALPSAMKSAQSGIDSLVRKGLEMEVWLREMAVSIAQTVTDVPVLGRVFGESATGLDEMRRSAQTARDTLNSFNAQGVTPAKVATAAAIPITTNYGQALEKVAVSTRAVTAAKKDAQPEAEKFTGLLSRTLNESGKLNTQLESWARINGAVLAPSIRDVNAELEAQGPLVNTLNLNWAQFAPTIQEVPKEGARAVGLFGTVMQGLPQIIMGAIQGGGSVINAAGAHIGTSLMDGFTKKFGPAIEAALPFGIGKAVTALLPLLGTMFGPVLSKIGGFFKNLFGGPSGDELAGRELVAKFEANIQTMLSDAGELQAGTESWRRTVVALTEAYVAQGRTGEEAARDAERLWASSRDGQEASAAIIAEIEEKMRSSSAAAVAGVNAINRAIDGLPDSVDIPITLRRSDTESGTYDPGYASGTMGRHGSYFKNFGAATPTVLHGNEAVITPRQAPAFAASVLGGGGSDPALLAAIRDLPRAIKMAMREGLVMA